MSQNKNLSNQGYLGLLQNQYTEEAEKYVRENSNYGALDVSSVIGKLKNGGVPFSIDQGQLVKEYNTEGVIQLLRDFAIYKLIEVRSNTTKPQVTLKSSSEYFNPLIQSQKTDVLWKLSKFSYTHFENGALILRNPLAKCYLVIHDKAVLDVFYAFQNPLSIDDALKIKGVSDKNLIDFFVHAHIITTSNQEGITFEEQNETLLQWEFHDLLFHSFSRIGRTEKNIGGHYRFLGKIPPQPALKENPWKENAIKLYQPNIHGLFQADVPFTTVLESRRSIREYSLLPLTIEQLGEFLFRSARVRYEYSNEYGDFISKPYPGGGANYETEFYITVNKCAGLKRGMYYYDAKEHTLCLVTEPNWEMETLIQDAHMAAAGLGTPHVLITLANRFNRFNWKYSSMSYAAQLKNIGVIYQTLYLVATAMNIGACGLGTGNTERFSNLTGLNYLEEGSVGEFMIGRPA